MNWAIVCGTILFACVLASVVLVSIFSQDTGDGEMIRWDGLSREKAKRNEASARQTLPKGEQLARIWTLTDSDFFQVPDEYRQAQRHQFAQLGYSDTSRGIVLTASSAYLDQATTLILELRQMGCTLPIEVWYRKGELGSDAIQVLKEKYRILCPCIDLVAPLPVLHKFSTKIVSMYLTTFDNFLYLDADNHVLKDPTYLFDSEAFQAHQALFWPDQHPLSPDSTSYQGWSDEQKARLPKTQQNSAQVMLNRSRYAPQLWKIYRLLENNLEALFPAPYNYGDKDMFHSTWVATNQSFSWIPHPVKQVLDPAGQVVGLLQSDPSGEPLFLQELSPGSWVAIRSLETGQTAPIPPSIEKARRNLQAMK